MQVGDPSMLGHGETPVVRSDLVVGIRQIKTLRKGWGNPLVWRETHGVDE